jgi:putative membrane protein
MPLVHETTLGSQLSDTVLLVGLAVAAAAGHLVGAGRLHSPARPFWAWQSWTWRRYAFCAGLAVLVASLLPVIDPVVDASFPLHMVQHMVLMFVAAPLLALGAPGLPLLLALPPRWRRRVNALRTAGPVRGVRAVAVMPAVALVVNAVVVVGWHLPGIYDAALRSDTVHVAEHLCFLLAAWLLWAPLAAPRGALDGGRAVLYVFVSGFPMVGVGAALVLADRPLYPAQTGTGPAALAAQQTAGVLMWIPPTFLSLVLCAALVLVWFRGMERTAPGDAPLPSAIPPALPPTRRAGVLTPPPGELLR